MKKLFTRAITGCVYVALIVFSLLCSTSVPFLVMFSILVALGLFEFYHIILNDKIVEQRTTLTTDIVGGVLLFMSVFWKANPLLDDGLWLVPYLAYIVTRLIIQLYTKESNSINNWAYSFMGQMYVALPLSLLNVIYFDYGQRLLLALFIFIWINDTGAFCFGSLFGKHRLFERISPKKSWEGFWGGLLLCIVTAIAFQVWCNDFFSGPDLYTWIGFAVVVSVFSTWGDLCESLIKRTLHVKDSGKLLPGHGGILDRIDSLLLVVPAVLMYLIIVNFFTSI